VKPAPQTVANAYQEHSRALWALCYRMTGSASEADDVVQGAFERLTHAPPRQLDAPLRPWLWKVAVNLCVDRLRLVGPRNVVRFFQGTAAKADPNFQVEVITLNGLPALRVDQPQPPSNIAPLTAVLLELEGERIRAFHLVLAPAKVRRLRPR